MLNDNFLRAKSPGYPENLLQTSAHFDNLRHAIDKQTDQGHQPQIYSDGRRPSALVTYTAPYLYPEIHLPGYTQTGVRIFHVLLALDPIKPQSIIINRQNDILCAEQYQRSNNRSDAHTGGNNSYEQSDPA